MDTIDISRLPIKASLVGQTTRDGWPCFEWRIEVSSKAGSWTFPFFCGLAHVERRKGVRDPVPPCRKGSVAYAEWEKRAFKPRRPSNEDILHSLILDSSAESLNFSDWCDELGMSDDSIKALNTYRECLEIGRALRKHLGRDAVEQLRIQLEDH